MTADDIVATMLAARDAVEDAGLEPSCENTCAYLAAIVCEYRRGLSVGYCRTLLANQGAMKSRPEPL